LQNLGGGEIRLKEGIVEECSEILIGGQRRVGIRSH
jgi:hypothetical protein